MNRRRKPPPRRVEASLQATTRVTPRVFDRACIKVEVVVLASGRWWLAGLGPDERRGVSSGTSPELGLRRPSVARRSKPSASGATFRRASRVPWSPPALEPTPRYPFGLGDRAAGPRHCDDGAVSVKRVMVLESRARPLRPGSRGCARRRTGVHSVCTSARRGPSHPFRSRLCCATVLTDHHQRVPPSRR
jgi:hypothetical protein